MDSKDNNPNTSLETDFNANTVSSSIDNLADDLNNDVINELISSGLKDSDDITDVFNILCKLIPSYDYIAEGVAAYLNKYPNGCKAVSLCDQIVIDLDTQTESKKDGVMFGCDDKLTFIGFGRVSHTLFETTHTIDTVENITIDKKKLIVTDDGQIFTYAFKKNVDIIKHISDIMDMKDSCVRVNNNFFRPSRTKIVMLTVGSRGDVQPFISLALGLMDRGYDVKIVTHSCFEEFVTSHDIEFYGLSCDPKELMRLCVSNAMMSVNFMKDSFKTFLPLIPTLLQEAWNGCKDANILIATPTSLAGYHIAEKLQIPFFNAFTMPFTYTTEQKNVMTMMTSKKEKQTWYTSAYNYLSDAMADKALWLSIRSKINRWRVNTLGLNEKGYFETNNSIFHSQKVFTLYCYSSVIYEKPSDWGENIFVTGYWRNNVEEGFTPSEQLQKFLRKYKNPVLISFGSISLPNPESFYTAFINVCKRHGQPVIVLTNWTDYELKPEDSVFVTKELPYDYILPYVKFMIHHGGAGTTASCIYHKKPMIIVPFFGDQFFWGARVVERGIGKVLSFKEIDSKDTSEGPLFEAVKELVRYDSCQKFINSVGDEVMTEDGIQNAITIIEEKSSVSLIPPSYVPDAETLKCANIECEAVFSALGKLGVGLLGEGRHHCRNCGKCFCHACTRKFIPIPKYRYNEPVRVCDECHPRVLNGY